MQVRVALNKTNQYLSIRSYLILTSFSGIASKLLYFLALKVGQYFNGFSSGPDQEKQKSKLNVNISFH